MVRKRWCRPSEQQLSIVWIASKDKHSTYTKWIYTESPNLILIFIYVCVLWVWPDRLWSVFAFYNILFRLFSRRVFCIFHVTFRVNGVDRDWVECVVYCSVYGAFVLYINVLFGWEIYSTIALGFVSFLSKKQIRFQFRIVNIPTSTTPTFTFHCVVRRPLDIYLYIYIFRLVLPPSLDHGPNMNFH